MNLITDRPSHAEIRALLREPVSPPILPAGTSPAWRKIFGRADLSPLSARLLARARCEADEPSTTLPTPSSGDLRGRLGCVAVAMLAQPEEERSVYLESFNRLFSAVAAETRWEMPAHTGPDAAIDPEGAQAAYLAAEMLAVFGRWIPSASADGLRRRLVRGVFDRYLACADSIAWAAEAGWANAVGHQGVLGAALAVDEDLDRVAWLLNSASPLLARYLEGIGADDARADVVEQRIRGLGAFSALNEMMEMRTGGALSLFTGNPEIARVAERAAGWGARREGGLTADWLFGYLGLRLGNEACCRRATTSFRRMGHVWETEMDAAGCCADFSHWQRVFRHAMAEDETQMESVPNRDRAIAGG